MSDLIDWLNILGDLTRLRIIRLLEEEELSVGEIARIVQLPQSTVSRHLKLMLESCWVVKRPLGTASMYRYADDLLDEDAQKLWKLAVSRLEKSNNLQDDDARLQEILAERKTDSRDFFGRLGGEWDQLRGELFGDKFTAEALLAFVDPDWVVADIGCGTGNASEYLAPLVKKVIAIDRESAMLDAARKRLERFDNIDFREGDLDDLPLAENELDAALIFLVMHHVETPADAIVTISEAIKNDGRLMVVDMIAHDREVYHHTMGHKHLGFTEDDIKNWSESAGFSRYRFARLRPETESKGPGLFVATMWK